MIPAAAANSCPVNASASEPFPGDDPAATRSSLLHRLKDWGDHGSWQDFFETL